MNLIPRIRDLEASEFNPFEADDAAWGAGVDDPYPTLAKMRRESPVHAIDYREIFTGSPDPTITSPDKFSVLGYDEVVEVLMDPQRFSNSLFIETLGSAVGRSIVMMDPPDHTRYRRIFQQAFLPNIVAKWQTDIIDPVIYGLVEQFKNRGKADLVKEFTTQFPFQIIYRQLALPPEDCFTFHKLAVAQNFTPTHPKEALEAGQNLGDYFAPLLDAREDEPGLDLVSMFASTQVEGERLPRDTAISFLRQLVNAAGDTTYRATGTMLMCLLNNPDQFEAIRNDRSLIPAAIEETLRWDTPVINTWRSATQDTTVGGMHIPAGAAVNVVDGAANRDETKFEDPDTFNFFRKSKHRHVGFATGPHVCIGQHLARLEMVRAMHAILDLLPGLRLDPNHAKPESKGFQLRTPSEIRVLFNA
jgi:cytochrome P450